MKRFFLNDAVDLVGLGTRSINSDSFTRCFEPISALEMHHSGPLYIFSLFIRYFILFPIRIIFFIFGTLIFFFLFLLGSITKNQNLFSKSFHFYCNIFCISFGARIRNHGIKKIRNFPHIYVANHTSFLDFIVLSSYKFCHASVAENHSGFLGFFLKKILMKNGSLHFKRSEKKDKEMVKKRIKEHIQKRKTPMLIFPEGTCVNNKYTVMFQKSVFELGVTICPVAIKYKRKLFDPYWNRRKHSFTEHILYLMSRWMIEVDVYWLDPIKKEKNENLQNFIEKVKLNISEKADLIPVKWNGYMKNQIIIKDMDILKNAYKDAYLNIFYKRKAQKILECKKFSLFKEENKNLFFKENNFYKKVGINVKQSCIKYELKISNTLEVQYFDQLKYEEFITEILNKYSDYKIKGNFHNVSGPFLPKPSGVDCFCKKKKILKNIKFIGGCGKETKF